jgi:hypothetical protein
VDLHDVLAVDARADPRILQKASALAASTGCISFSARSLPVLFCETT